MNKNKVLATLLVALAAPSLQALSFNANVNDPSPGVFFGSGNANGGWAVGTSNGIELGIRTHRRYPAPANVFSEGSNVGIGVYEWADQNGYNGAQNRSSWNYDFSLNVFGASGNIGDYIFRLYIDSDPSAAHIWNVIDPSAIPDNAVSGTAYEQNSENLRFPIVGIPGYDNTIAGTYDFAIKAFSGSTELATTYMRVNVNGGTASGAFDGNVPDGGSMGLMLGSVVSAIALMRRKAAK